MCCLTTGYVGSLNRSRASADTLVSSCKSLCLAASSIKQQQNCNIYSQAPGDCSTCCEKCSVGEVSRLKTFVLQSNFFQGNRFSLKKLAKCFRYVLKYKNMETVLHSVVYLYLLPKSGSYLKNQEFIATYSGKISSFEGEKHTAFHFPYFVKFIRNRTYNREQGCSRKTNRKPLLSL